MPKTMKYLQQNSLSFAIPFIVYLFTLNPIIGFIDNGELVAACRTLGIAHPTGYPLFTMLGRIATFFPINNPAYRINMLSALFSSLATLFFFLFLRKRTQNSVIALAGALLIAFSRIVWHQSTSAEVYSLSFLMLALLLYVHASKIRNRLLLIAFLSGLALANHMIIITFIVPFFVYLLLTREFKSFKLLLFFALFFFLGISVYLYLPIRAHQHPLLNWGRTVNLERFLWHVTGKQYRVWMFTGDLKVLRMNAWNFLKLLASQYTPFLIPFAVIGIFHVWKTSKPRLAFLLVLFVVNTAYAINYEIPDIEPYFFIAIFIYTLLIIYGLRFLAQKRKWLIFIAPCLALFALIANFRASSERGNYFAYDMCTNLFSSVKPNGIVITHNWDYYSPALYQKYIEGKRPDIVFIDKELLRRSWYFDYLEMACPWLIENSQREVVSYLELLDDFEHNRLESPQEIQNRFIVMINSFIDNNIDKHPCYITFINGSDVDAPSIAPQYAKIPVGIVYEISKEPDTSFFDYSQFKLRAVFKKYPSKDERTQKNLDVYPLMSMKRAIFLLQMGNFNSSIKTLEFASQWENTQAASYVYQAAAYLFLDQQGKSIAFFKKAQALKPDDALISQSIHMLEAGNSEELKNHFMTLFEIRSQN